jgi:hypothetical protein
MDSSRNQDQGWQTGQQMLFLSGWLYGPEVFFRVGLKGALVHDKGGMAEGHRL